MPICPSCGAEAGAGQKFGASCGSPLGARCPQCGATTNPGQRFCAECGTPLAGTAPSAPTPAPAAEVRLVSVMFVDLVGFTSLSESRDPEDVRDLLSRYFQVAREAVAKYGGTNETFIGDAVMAVWGTPVAREDNATRAVLAALDLVEGVTAFGREIGFPDRLALA